MIVIASTLPRERAALGSLCDSRGWHWKECDSLRTLKRSLRPTAPSLVLMRHRLSDGYSDEAIAVLKAASLLATTKLVVLVSAGFPSSLEARQIALGADLVQRDPVRMDVLLEYLQKFLDESKRHRGRDPQTLLKPFEFAGGRVHPVDRKLERGKITRHLTPREVELAELLVQSADQLVTYETLFHDILGRPFRGETSNLRVLLGKLADSAEHAGIDLRQWVEVIPKLGYRYHTAPKVKPSPR
jgi:DNA-binding response OmpR family regulator